jgi:hypothetical protein
MKTWFDLVEMQLDLTPKISLPRTQTWSSSIENGGIPLIPESPGSNQEYFHGERALKGMVSKRSQISIFSTTKMYITFITLVYTMII